MAVLKELSLTDNIIGQLVLWNVILVLTCLLGDLLCSATAQYQLLWRALSDSATHGAVAVLAWAVVVMPGVSVAKWIQCVLCGVLASIIDVDHFLQAGSFQLQAAVTLQHRPPFHSSSVVIAVTSLLWVVSLILQLPQLRKVSLMCFMAWSSHHLRDATRRGLWFPPFGSTPPVPYVLYLVGTVTLSVAGHYVYSVCCDMPSSERQSMSVSEVIVQ